MRRELANIVRELLFSVLLMTGCLLMTSISFAQNYTVDISSYNSFRNQVYGHAYDIDNQYGAQCWDGAALLWQQLGRGLITGNGAAAGTWDNAQTNAGNDFDLVTGIQNVKRGDVVVFGYDATYFNTILNGNIAAGHIAFADEDYDGSGRLNILGQNQLGVGAFSVQRVGVSAFRGAFRLKTWNMSRFAYNIDSIVNTKDGLKISGWVYDKQATSSQVDVHVYVGAPANTGEGHNLGSTDLARGDVNNTFGISGKHGFSKTFTTVYSGTQTIYIYAITADGSYNELIATNTLLIGNDPIGNVESVTSPCAGVIRVVGWTIDKDGEGYPNSIHVYVGAPAGTSGAEVHPVDVNNQNLLAHEYREDVDTVHKFGKYHGFEVFIPTNKTGTQPVYVYGINLGNGSNAAIGNKQVTISTDDHKYDTGTTTRPATCTAGGTKNVTCTKCTLKTTIGIPAFGHNYGEWSVTKAATYDAEGEEQRVCAHDASHIETRAIAKKVKPAEEPQPSETEEKPGETQPTQPETQAPTQPETQAPTQPETQVPTQPETQDQTQPETQAPSETDTTPDIAVTPETEIDEAAAPTASAQQKTILNQKNDNDPKGSTFGLLQAKAVKVTKNSIRIQWKKVKGATKYIVYGNKCGKSNRYKKIKTVKTTSFTQKKLKKGTYYKYSIVAIKGSKAIATSKTIHVATTGGKVGNSKSVKVNKKTFKIGVNQKATLKATAVAASKKLKVKKHRAIAFESSNKNIATVSKKGVIKGIRKGKCYIYAYAQNGVMAKVKVVVS